jgi:hypothetical protein
VIKNKSKKVCLRWIMRYNTILRLYLIAQKSRAMPGKKRYNWDT